MPTADSRWATLSALKGLRVEDDHRNYESIKAASVRRHPHHSNYIKDVEEHALSDVEAKLYGELNDLLHEKLATTARKHFRETPVPDALRRQADLNISATPFTYQNRDWYGPSYECYFVVWEDALSSRLLMELQSILSGEHVDWCIVVCTADDTDFATNHEIAVFSDEVLIPESAIVDLKMRL